MALVLRNHEGYIVARRNGRSRWGVINASARTPLCRGVLHARGCVFVLQHICTIDLRVERASFGVER